MLTPIFNAYLICTGGGFPDPRLKLCCFPEMKHKNTFKSCIYNDIIILFYV